MRLLDFVRLGEAVARIREAVRLQPSVKLEQPVRTLSCGEITGEFSERPFDREKILRTALAGHERPEVKS